MQLTNTKTLLIMAGGLGSRYQSLKQIDGIFENGETLLEFSIFDALRCGFKKVVIIINELMPKSYIERVSKIASNENFELIFIVQKKESGVPNVFSHLIESRVKPWGTAHAILCAKEVIQEPFVVINADDYYGVKSWGFSSNLINENIITAENYAMVSFPIEATLSKNGSVSRGICAVNSKNQLEHIVEKTKIYQKTNHIVYLENKEEFILNSNAPVSMNFWCFHPSIFNYLELYFLDFLENEPNPKQEIFIPSIIEKLIHDNKITVEVLSTSDQWKGLTYLEDKEDVCKHLLELKENNTYPESLWKN